MEKNLPLISVLIPLYNAGGYFRACLESVLAQTYGNLQVVVVNDGSTDSSLAVAEEYASRDSRVEVIDKENGGVMLARKICVENARGEYVFFIDADDYISHDLIERLYEAVCANDSQIASASYIRVAENYASLTAWPFPLKCYDSAEFTRILLQQHAIYLAGKLFRRDMFDGVKFFEGMNFGEDFLINLQVATGPGFRSICFIEGAYYFYVQHKGSLSRRKDDHGYYVRLIETTRGIIESRPETAEQFRTELLAENVLRYSMYIRKSRNAWHGDSEFARWLRDEVKANRRALKGKVSPLLIRMVLMYPRRANKRLINLMIIPGRWSNSFRKRTRQRVDLGQLLEQLGRENK